MHVHHGLDGVVEVIEDCVGHRLGGCLDRSCAGDHIVVNVMGCHEDIMILIQHRQMTGLCAADDEFSRLAIAYADVAKTNALLFVKADKTRFI